MSTDNLIKMANQIAQFFASEPDKILQMHNGASARGRRLVDLM